MEKPVVKINNSAFRDAFGFDWCSVDKPSAVYGMLKVKYYSYPC